MKILVTGGAGFIGSAVVRHIITNTHDQVVNVDKLTYAGNLESLNDVSASERYVFEHADICDKAAMDRIFAEHNPDAVMHLAAESHVDRSITGPAAFIETNIVGTYVLLEAARAYWSTLDDAAKKRFASIISPPMKYTAICRTRMNTRYPQSFRCSLKPRPTRQAAHTLPPKRPATIWFAPGCAPTVSRQLSPIVQTTTVRIISRKS